MARAISVEKSLQAIEDAADALGMGNVPKAIDDVIIQRGIVAVCSTPDEASKIVHDACQAGIATMIASSIDALAPPDAEA